MSDETKDLYKLIGNYEATTKTIFQRLDKIDKDNGKILDSVKDIEFTCQELDAGVAANKESITDLEKHGVPKRTNQKIDTGLFLGILNAVITVVKAALGWG